MGALASTRCQKPTASEHRGHLFLESDTSAERQRCKLTCAKPRVTKANKGKCPAWALVDMEWEEIIAARPWARWMSRLPTTWRPDNGGIVKLDAARSWAAWPTSWPKHGPTSLRSREDTKGSRQGICLCSP